MDPVLVRIVLSGVIFVCIAQLSVVIAEAITQPRPEPVIYEIKKSRPSNEPEYSPSKAKPWPLHLPPVKPDF